MRHFRDIVGAGRADLSRMHGNLSGVLVLLLRPYRRDRQELLATVLKYDHEPDIWERFRRRDLGGEI